MGYTTEFSGQIKVDPPLNAEEIAFLTKFSETRRMHRKNGPYYVDGGGYAGQDAEPDIIEYNRPPVGQPSLWCQWIPTDDGTAIEWNGGEKFYDSAEWMKYLIDHFLKPGAIAKNFMVFLQDHVCDGIIDAQGEDSSDTWRLIVEKNVVKVAQVVSRQYSRPTVI